MICPSWRLRFCVWCVVFEADFPIVSCCGFDMNGHSVGYRVGVGW